MHDASFLLKTYGSRLGGFSDQVAEITVTSKFPDSEILKNGGILVDTPGAEIAFGEEDPENVTGKEFQPESVEKNEKDTQRALDILNATQIIIFCERADYLEGRNSKLFYNMEMKKRHPLNVLNFKDTFEIDQTADASAEILEKIRQNQMIHRMVSAFGANIDRVICVSSREASQGKKNNDDTLLAQSNILVLEELIIGELRSLQPQFGLTTCLKELHGILQQINSGKKILKIDQLLMDNFIKSIEKKPEFSKTLDTARRLL